MIKIKLEKEINLPQNKEDLESETIEEKHERFLRRLIIHNKTPIYLGDRVKVSERWVGNSKNPHEGKEGNITYFEEGLQGIFNSDYFIYQIETENGESFETYHYTLDRLDQPKGNKLLEKILKDTNLNLKIALFGGQTKK